MDDETLIARWQTRGGRYWYELTRATDGSLRLMGDGSRAVYPDTVSVDDAIGDAETRIHVAKVIDGINYKRTQ